MGIALTLVALAALAALTFALRPRPMAPAGPGQIDSTAYSGLRAAFFSTRAESLSGRPTPDEGAVVSEECSAGESVHGAAIEIGFPPGTVTVVALADGTASLYLETGGGITGAGRPESVHRHAQSFVERAGALLELGETVSGAPPLPGNREVRFHWLGADGVRSAVASELELSVGSHPLAGLYRSGQDLLEQIRVAHSPTATRAGA